MDNSNPTSTTPTISSNIRKIDRQPNTGQDTNSSQRPQYPLKDGQLPTLGNMDASILIGQDNIHLSTPTKFSSGPNNTPSANFFKLGWTTSGPHNDPSTENSQSDTQYSVNHIICQRSEDEQLGKVKERTLEEKRREQLEDQLEEKFDEQQLKAQFEENFQGQQEATSNSKEINPKNNKKKNSKFNNSKDNVSKYSPK